MPNILGLPFNSRIEAFLWGVKDNFGGITGFDDSRVLGKNNLSDIYLVLLESPAFRLWLRESTS